MQNPVSLLTPWLPVAFKIGMLVWLGVYVMFAIVIVRQIELMLASFKTPHERWLRLLAYVHLGIVLLLIVIAIVL